ncbi:MAG: hypothetical protein WDO69_04105 [Pseudomonadota bacterium]
MTPCAGCGAQLPATSFKCLECAAEPEIVVRRRTGVELKVMDSEVSRLESALLLMTGAPRESVRAIVERLQLELVAELTAAELDQLSAALSQLGVSFRQSQLTPTLTQHSLRFEFDAHFLLRLAVVLSVAVGTAFLGASAISWLALPVILVHCWGAVERIPHALEIPRSFVEEKLGAVDRTVWNELTVVRRGIKGPEGASAARRCLAPLAAIIEQIRSGGLHLTRADFSNLDHDAHALLRRSFRLAAAADRVARACAEPSLSAQRPPRLASASREMFAALAGIEHKLEALRLSLVELSGFEARNEGWSGATTRLTEIQVAVETGLELSVFASEEASRQQSPGAGLRESPRLRSRVPNR